jgi:hypothetical protein
MTKAQNVHIHAVCHISLTPLFSNVKLVTRAPAHLVVASENCQPNARFLGARALLITLRSFGSLTKLMGVKKLWRA